MSLILDALNRAERERKKNQEIPGLQTVHEPLPATADPSAGRNPVLIVLVVLVVGLLVGMIYLFARAPERAPEIASPLVQSTTEAVNQRGTQAGSQALNDTARVPPAPSSSVAPAPVEAGNSRPKLPAGTDRVAAPAPRAAPQSELNELYASARAEDEPKDPVTSLYAAPEIENPTVARRETVAALPPVAVRNYDSLIEIPDIGDLPWGFRQEIPSINYIRHNFGESGAHSVVINSKAHYAGSTLAPDLVLEEIYVDGAIFQFKQIKFKLRALNSWVNM